jgi:hypothetical protein
MLPPWALIPMWISTLIGAWFLSKDMIARFGHA